MTEKQENIIFRARKANTCAESACWWMKDIDTAAIDDLGVLSKIQDVLDLLRKVDDITMDIIITVRTSE